MKLLIDTDIGSDIDDCLALAYLLGRSDTEIVGITTTTGLPQLRAQLADAVCKAAGKDIPVHVGFEKPLSGELRQPTLTKNQTAVAEGNPKKFSKNITAIEFMRKVIEANPHEITLVCIGPMTNAAVLFSIYPEIHRLLAGMVIMGGRYGDCDSSYWGETEWNIVCDTLAASIVFSRDIPNCFVIGVEQTSTYSEDPYYIKTAFKSIAGLEPVYQSINTLAKRIWFHDPLALYAFFNQSEVELTRGNISVSPFSEKLPAATYFKKADDGRHFLITSYSPDKFFADFAKHTKLKL